MKYLPVQLHPNLHRALKSPDTNIFGMGCIFPGAHSPEELWRNVLAGHSYFLSVPSEHMAPHYFDLDPAAPDKSYCDKIAVIAGWQCDPSRFLITPNSVHASDMTHCWSLTRRIRPSATPGLTWTWTPWTGPRLELAGGVEIRRRKANVYKRSGNNLIDYPAKCAGILWIPSRMVLFNLKTLYRRCFNEQLNPLPRFSRNGRSKPPGRRTGEDRSSLAGYS